MKRPVKRERESGPVKLPTIAAYLMFVNAINSSKIYAHGIVRITAASKFL